ncbi:MAG: response regulator [Bdellovibrionales bacterium]|nr:response regulator [Bdellovibrionales bacterium]
MSIKSVFKPIAPQSDGASRPSEYLTLSYLWFVLLVLAGMGVAREAQLEELNTFLIFGTSLSIALALSLLVLPKAAMRAAPLIHVVMCFLPLALPYTQSLRSVVFLSIFYTGLLLLPPVLSVWSWRTHAWVAGLSAIAAVLRLWQFHSEIASISMLCLPLIAASSVLFSSLTDLRRRGRTRSIAALESLQTVFRVPSIWPVVVLQCALLLFLVVFERSVLGAEGGTAAKIYGACIVLFGALLLTILRPRYRSAFVLFNVLLIGVLLSLGSLDVWTEHLGRSSAWLWTFLPLVFLAHSTSALPWPVTMQVLVAWGLTLSGLIAFARSYASATESSGQSWVYALLERGMHYEIAFLVTGVALSVFVARAVRQHRLVNFPRLAGPDYFTQLFDRVDAMHRAEDVAPPEELAWSSADGILFERMSQMLQGLFIVGFAACFGMSVLSAGTAGVPISWAVFVSLWLIVLFLARRNLLHEWLGAFGSFTGLMLYLGPTCMILYLGIREGPWLVFPLGLMMSLSIIPWQLSEIIPLVCTGVFVSSYLLSGVDSGGGAYVALFGSACISVLWSVRSYRETKEQYLMNKFHDALTTARGPRDCLRILSDFLVSLFGANGALVKTDEGALDVVRNMHAFPVLSDIPASAALEREVALSGSDPAATVINIADGFEPDLYFFDARFGVFGADQGALLILPERQAVNRRSPSETCAVRSWIFVPLVTPLSRFLLRREKGIAESLAAQAVTQVALFEELAARVHERAQTEQARARQEYEWSSVVHDINNTVQDVTMLCDATSGDLAKLAESEIEGFARDDSLARVERIKAVVRSMAVLVSDTKRKRELKRLRDLTPRERVDCVDTMRTCLSFAKIRGERRRVAVHVVKEGFDDAKNAVVVHVSAREHLETVFRIILSGAINISKPGTSINVVLKASSDWVWFNVSDSGPGYSEAELGALFVESGERLSAQRSSEVSYVDVRRFAESQGGSFEVSSGGAGSGAKASLMLPRAAGEDKVERPYGAWALIVDDESILTVSYSRIAKALGLEPVVATNIDDAKRTLSERRVPTVVVTDLNLGDGGFLPWIEYLREATEEDTPIVVVTGMEDRAVESQVRARGIAEYIIKPVGQRSLYSAIRKVLERGR